MKASAVVTVAACVVLVGAWVQSFCGASAIACAGSDQVLRVRRLELVDKEGKVRTTMEVEPGGVAIRLLDQHGGLAMALEVRNDAARDRPLLTIFSADGKASAALGNTAFQLAGASDVAWTNKAPMLVFLDGDGRPSWHAPNEIVGPWKDARFVH